MYTEIKTFEDACKAINVEPTIIPDFSLFPESDQQAMIAHAKLVINIIGKAHRRSLHFTQPYMNPS